MEIKFSKSIGRNKNKRYLCAVNDGALGNQSNHVISQ